jgi:hypothetical protein
MGLFSVVFVVLFILKLIGVVTMSWFYVFLPVVLDILISSLLILIIFYKKNIKK